MRMSIPDNIPEYFPGKEFATDVSWGRWENYLYERCWLRHAHTTNGQQIALPLIEYRFAGWSKDPEDSFGVDESAYRITYDLLDDSQKAAIAKARRLGALRRSEDPNRNTFAGLRALGITKDRLIYTCAPEEGQVLHNDVPFCAVKSLDVLGIVDFATETWGYYGFFEYDQADMDAFVPPALYGQANAYLFIDDKRIVIDSNGKDDIHIAKVMLLRVESDLDFPIERYRQNVID